MRRLVACPLFWHSHRIAQKTSQAAATAGSMQQGQAGGGSGRQRRAALTTLSKLQQNVVVYLRKFCVDFGRLPEITKAKSDSSATRRRHFFFRKSPQPPNEKCQPKSEKRTTTMRRTTRTSYTGQQNCGTSLLWKYLQDFLLTCSSIVVVAPQDSHSRGGCRGREGEGNGRSGGEWMDESLRGRGYLLSPHFQ